MKYVMLDVNLEHVVVWSVVALIAYLLWTLIAAARRGRLNVIYRRAFPESRHERMFLASAAFFLTFAIVRIITYMNHNGIGPFHDIYVGGRHVHHLVFGITLLLVVGYGWLAGVGTGAAGANIWLARVMAALYGLGAALTLDEFALWLNLRDVYWAREGRTSIRVAFLFGGMLAMGIWGGPFLQAASNEALKLFKRNSKG